MICYRRKITISPTASFLLSFLFFFFTACFRPAPPLEEGDERTAKVSARTETNGSITVEGHPIVKKRVAPRWSTPTPSTTVAKHSPPQTTTGGGAPTSGSGGTSTIEPGGSSNPTSTTVVRWSQESFIKAANADPHDFFGFSLSISGDSLAVGAYAENANQSIISNGSTASSDDFLSDSGAVYVYRRSGVNWAQEAYVKATNAGAADQFGYSVALSGDTLAVGAPLEDSNQTTITNGAGASANNSVNCPGAVYVYRRSGVNWAQEAYVKAVNADAANQFGHSVALSGDTLAVGAQGEDSNQTTITNGTTASADKSAFSAGAVYVYRRSGVNWAQEAYVKAANAGVGDNLGYSVALSGDTLAASAFLEDSNQTTITNGTSASLDNSATNSGAVYVYHRSGVNWAQEAYVKAANAGAADWFGHSVALSGDTLAVGAPLESSNQITITNGTSASADNAATNSGAVYVYHRSGVNWAQEAYVKAANAGAADWFGHSVALSGDTLAVGAPYEDSYQTTITNGSLASDENSQTNAGAVYVYRNTSKLFDPDVRVIATSQESISFAWGANLGSSSQIKVALAAYGRNKPEEFCTDANSTLLSPGTTTYTYSGLSAGSKYGFRFCSWDGNTASPGATVWVETEAQNFESGTDNWVLIGNQNPTANRNQVYTTTPSNKMYGPFQMGESISKQFQLNGEFVTASFDFLRLNSWDGEQFRVYIKDDSGVENLLFSESFQHGTFSYNYFGASLGYSWWISSLPQNTFCFPTCTSWTSARHRVTIITPAPTNSLTLRLTTTLDQGIGDESWGIDNFRLSP